MEYFGNNAERSLVNCAQLFIAMVFAMLSIATDVAADILTVMYAVTLLCAVRAKVTSIEPETLMTVAKAAYILASATKYEGLLTDNFMVHLTKTVRLRVAVAGVVVDTGLDTITGVDALVTVAPRFDAPATVNFAAI